jgi:class 3 adenylate cyclase
MLRKALIVFVDIRGFTTWSADPDVHDNVVEFVATFDDLLKERFPAYHQKYLGDGAMLVRELDNGDDPLEVIGAALDTIAATDVAFSGSCDAFYTRHGARTELHLGWGITRGDVWRNRVEHHSDYLGRNINEAAKLCGKARPYGIVIDADDFRALPQRHGERFMAQRLTLDGFQSEIEAWVTPEIAERMRPRGVIREQPEVFVSGVCVRRERGELEVLVMKRGFQREFYPGLLEVSTGGQLAKDETFLHGVLRHVERELGLGVEVDESNFMIYQFGNREGEVIPGIRYLCWHRAGQPQLLNYEEFHWMNVAKLKDTPDEEFLPGVRTDVLAMLARIPPAPHAGDARPAGHGQEEPPARGGEGRLT